MLWTLDLSEWMSDIGNMLLYLFSIKSAFTHGLHDRLMYGTATTLLPFKIPYKRRYIQHLPHVQPHLQHCARLTHCLVQHAATQHSRCPTQSVCSCDYGDHAPRNSLVQPLQHCARLTHCQVRHAATQHSRCPTRNVWLRRSCSTYTRLITEIKLHATHLFNPSSMMHDLHTGWLEI